MKSALIIFRWILFIPVYIVAFLAINLIAYYCFWFWDQYAAEAVTNQANFGGRWFWGIVFTFQQAFISTLFAAYISCIKVAPNPRIAYYTLLVINLLYTGFLIAILIMDSNKFTAFKTIISMLGTAFAFVIWFGIVKGSTNEELEKLKSSDIG